MQSIGKTVGGLNTKIHTLSDALGNPLKFILSKGNLHDSQVANLLIDNCMNSSLLADKAYDSQSIVDKSRSQNMEVIIPTKENSKNPRIIDKHIYKNRGLIENLFQRMKVFRRISTRYDKLDSKFLSFIYIGGIFKWLH